MAGSTQPVTMRNNLSRWALNESAVMNGKKQEALVRSPKLDLLLVNKGFYFAGLEAYIENHELLFESTLELHQWIQSLRIDRKKAVRTVALACKWTVTISRPLSAAEEVSAQPRGYDVQRPLPANFKMLAGLRKLVVLVRVEGRIEEIKRPEEERDYIERYIRRKRVSGSQGIGDAIELDLRFDMVNKTYLD